MKPPFKSAASVKAVTPSIVMYDPRFPHNVGAAVRAASCFDVHQVWITGKRTAEQVWKAKRIPREERMKGFNDVELILDDRPFDHFPRGTTPVAIELLPNAQSLLGFEHPENPVYVFGPEDGSVPAQVEKAVRIAGCARSPEKQADVARIVEVPARPVGSSDPEGVAIHRQVFGVLDSGVGNETARIFRDVGVNHPERV